MGGRGGGGVKMFVGVSCFRNRDNLWPCIPLGPRALRLFCLLYIAYATKYIVCPVRLDRCFVAGFSDGINVTLFYFIF